MQMVVEKVVLSNFCVLSVIKTLEYLCFSLKKNCHFNVYKLDAKINTKKVFHQITTKTE